MRVVIIWLVVPAGLLAVVPFPFGGLVRLRLAVGWIGTFIYVIESLVLSWILGNAIGTEGSRLAYVAWAVAPIVVLCAGLGLALLQRHAARRHLAELQTGPTNDS
jgi:hypothetical protein